MNHSPYVRSYADSLIYMPLVIPLTRAAYEPELFLQFLLVSFHSRHRQMIQSFVVIHPSYDKITMVNVVTMTIGGGLQAPDVA